jgi:PDZ domain
VDGLSCLRTAAIFTLLVVAGCVNGFEKYYKPSPNADQILKSPYNAPVSATPLIYNYSNDPKVDNHNALRAGYVPIGSADFYANARKVSQSQLVAQAKSVGASLVLIHTSFRDTVSGSVPFTVPNAPIVSTVSTSGTVNSYGSGGYATGTYSGTGTITTPGGSTTYQMPYQFDRNNYDATFWVKRDTSKIMLGINPGPLTDAQRHELQRNSGIVAAVVVNGTPAFQANILEGDILLKINDEDLIEPATMVAQTEKYAGQTVTFQILRDGQPKTIRVTLRPSQAR